MLQYDNTVFLSSSYRCESGITQHEKGFTRGEQLSCLHYSKQLYSMLHSLRVIEHSANLCFAVSAGTTAGKTFTAPAADQLTIL